MSKQHIARILLRVAANLLMDDAERALRSIAQDINRSSGVRGNPAMGKVQVEHATGVGAALIIPFLVAKPNSKALLATYTDTQGDMEQLSRSLRKAMKGLHPKYMPYSEGRASGFAMHLIVPASEFRTLKRSVGSIGRAIAKAATAFKGAYKARLKEASPKRR